MVFTLLTAAFLLAGALLCAVHRARRHLCRLVESVARLRRSRPPHTLGPADIPALRLLSVCALGAGLWQSLVDRAINSNGFAVVMGYPVPLANAIGWSMVVGAFSAALLLHAGLKHRGFERWLWIATGLLIAGANGVAQGYVAHQRVIVLNQWTRQEEPAAADPGGSFRLAGQPAVSLQPVAPPPPAPATPDTDPWAMAAIPFGLALIGALSLGLGLHSGFTIIDLRAKAPSAPAATAAVQVEVGGKLPEAEAAKSLIGALAAVGEALYPLLRLPLVPLFSLTALLDGIHRWLRSAFRRRFPAPDERVAVETEREAQALRQQMKQRHERFLARLGEHEQKWADGLARQEQGWLDRMGSEIADLTGKLFADAKNAAFEGDEEEFLRRLRRIPLIFHEFSAAASQYLRCLTGSLAEAITHDVSLKVDADLAVGQRSAVRQGQFQEADRLRNQHRRARQALTPTNDITDHR
jgi:hypothetical protein